MKNFDLNPGGVIGALAFFGIAVVVCFLLVSDPDSAFSAGVRFPVIALIGGAFIGNFLWRLIFNNHNGEL